MRELHLHTMHGSLAALQWGDNSAPPLLALHGWLDNAASFDAVAPLLAKKFQVIALDMPGHGHSAHLPGSAIRYHVIDQVDVVLDAADALHLQGFSLLGHSLGAGVASLVAAAVPERIDRQALIEGLGPLADDGSNTLKRWRDAHAQRGASRKSPRVFANIDDAVAARVAAGDLDAVQVRPIVERNLRETDGGFAWRSDPRLRQTTPLRIEEMQLRRLLAGIAARTFLLLADPETPYLPRKMIDARAACVRDIHVERMRGIHHLHVQHPGEVAERLLAFFVEK